MTLPLVSRSSREWRPHSTTTLVVWSIIALIVFIGFIELGNWQLRRLSWKLNLIAEAHHNAKAPPVPAPGPARWAKINHGHEQFLHVRVTGKYLNQDETLVRGSSKLGYGFWVMTPLRSQRGFIVLINRGFISSSFPKTPAFRGMARPQETVTVTGLLRHSIPGGGFLRPNQPAKNLWYSRDVKAIASALHLPMHQVVPYFIDAAARPGTHAVRHPDFDINAPKENYHWPVGGLTVIHFWNHHLNYAITWYCMAAMTLLGFAIGAWFELRSRR